MNDDDDDLIDFEQVYVASADNVSEINEKLSQGFHVVLQPGIYELDQALNVKHDGQVLLGIGMATLVATNGDSCVEVADGIDARIAGLTLEAGKVRSPTLLKWGSDTTVGNSTAPGVISDVFGRTGGRTDSRDFNVESDLMFEINNQHVIIDHTWLWRADHDVGGLVYESRNYSGSGLRVNADHVKAYGLFSEHHLGDLVQWNGNNGEVYFFQSELPYDVTNENYADKGYTGFRVSDDVTDFTGYGIAVYSFFRDHDVWVDTAIKAPVGPKINFTNSYSMFLTGQGGIKHILNDQGTGVQDSFRNSYLCTNDTSIESFIQTKAGADLFLQ